MIRLLLIVIGYGSFLLVFTYGIAWCVGRWQQKEARKPPQKRIVFRDDGELAEQAQRRMLDSVMSANEKPHTAMSARRQNVQASGLGRDRKRVSR